MHTVLQQVNYCSSALDGSNYLTLSKYIFFRLGEPTAHFLISWESIFFFYCQAVLCTVLNDWSFPIGREIKRPQLSHLTYTVILLLIDTCQNGSGTVSQNCEVLTSYNYTNYQ